jgi:hypothetical protein
MKFALAFMLGAVSALGNLSTEEDIHQRIAEMLIEEDIQKQIKVNQLNDRKLSLLSQLQEIDGSLNLEDAAPVTPAPAGDDKTAVTPTAGAPADDKSKTATKDGDAKTDVKGADPKTADPAAAAGSNAWLYILIAVGVVGIGAGAFFFLRKKSADQEGGEADAYTKFLDEELA